jgi:subtilisin family serine protease
MTTDRSGLRLCRLPILLTVVLLASGLSSPTAEGAESKKQPPVYVVQLSENPVVAHAGGQAGLPATRPRRGEKIDPNSPNVRKYVAFLDSRHAAVLRAAGVAQDAKFYDYRYSFNGFAAVLTADQAARIARMPGVIAVTRDELRRPLTDNTPSFLGLSGPGGLWEQVGGVGSAGENVIIGVIDLGIWPEHPSFSDQADLADRPGDSGKQLRVYGPPPAGWHGTCQSGEKWSKDDCNNKLIGARYFLAGFGFFGIIKDDYKSPRDADGHGSHTASTAGGNAGVDPSIFGRDLGVGTISGMAPRARLAMYKACWNDEGCASSDLVSAIDAAVSDGVDVINYSLGSDTPSLLFPDAVALLFAADAGVFVAAANGNAGPGPGTGGSPASAPWVTAVGASKHSRTFLGVVTLGNGATYTGASVTPGTGVLPLVDGAAAGSELCLIGALNPSAVAGKIVLCKRGTNARVEKSEAVAIAGGAGMILYNVDASDILTDNHFVPSVHLEADAGADVKTYIAAAGAAATARITAGTAFDEPFASDIAFFSARGPNGAAPDVIKPDVTAPGINVLAANTPTPLMGAPGQLFQSISGTSMSSPHVAGVAALLVQLHPDWTPAMIRSALMTTGHQDVDKDDGTTDADPFDMGGGHIRPLPAADPGLAYDAGLTDYLKFLCGTGALSATGPTCTAVGKIDPSNLNLPSIGIADLAGIQTVTRRVTNVGPAGTYTVEVEAPAGIDVVVAPPALTLGAGESATYEVTFTTTPAAVFDEWTFGSLTWSDGAGRAARSPIAIKPITLLFPAEFSGTGATGSGEWEITFGYSGSFLTAVHGLVPATTETNTVVDDPANDIEVALDTGIGIETHTISVSAGTRHLRVALFDEETDGNDDIDLYLYDPNGDLVAESTTPTSTESIDVSNPTAGDWKLVVHGWQTDGPDVVYTLFSWVLDDADAGNLTASAPGSAVIGATDTVHVSWSGLAANTRYLGSVSYNDGVFELGQTLVSITSPSGALAGRADHHDRLIVGRRQAGRETEHLVDQSVDGRGFRVEGLPDPLGAVLLLGRARRFEQAVRVQHEAAVRGQLDVTLGKRLQGLRGKEAELDLQRFLELVRHALLL